MSCLEYENLDVFEVKTAVCPQKRGRNNQRSHFL